MTELVLYMKPGCHLCHNAEALLQDLQASLAFTYTAIDITLDSFSQYLADRKVSPGSLSFILDSQGRVIAASDKSRTYASDEGRIELRHISSLDNELPSAAFSARPRDADRIRALHPDLLLTQALCDVCAVSETDVRALAAKLTRFMGVPVDADRELVVTCGATEAMTKSRPEITGRVPSEPARLCQRTLSPISSSDRSALNCAGILSGSA